MINKENINKKIISKILSESGALPDSYEISKVNQVEEFIFVYYIVGDYDDRHLAIKISDYIKWSRSEKISNLLDK